MVAVVTPVGDNINVIVTDHINAYSSAMNYMSVEENTFIECCGNVVCIHSSCTNTHDLRAITIHQNEHGKKAILYCPIPGHYLYARSVAIDIAFQVVDDA